MSELSTTYAIAKEKIAQRLPFAISEELEPRLQKLTEVSERNALNHRRTATQAESNAINMVYRAVESDYQAHLDAGNPPHVSTDRPSRNAVLDLNILIKQAIEEAIQENHGVEYHIGMSVRVAQSR